VEAAVYPKVGTPTARVLTRLGLAFVVAGAGLACGPLKQITECSVASECDSGFECREGKCVVAGSVACEVVADCDEAKEKGTWKIDPADCEQLACTEKICQLEPKTNGTECNDDDAGSGKYSCTQGACNAGKCLPGKIVDDGKCFIGGKDNAEAGQCATKGDNNTANVCEVCEPGTDKWGWSPSGTDTPCTGDDDTKGCGEGRCDGQRKCTSNAHVAEGFCCIDCKSTAAGACVKSGDANGSNACQLCNPVGSKTTWTSAMPGADCTDSDGLACTSGGCDTQGGCTQVKVASGACLITGGDGKKVCKTKDDDDGSGCKVCDPDKANEDWTLRDKGTACTKDGHACTVDECDGQGACQANVAIAKDQCFIKVDGSEACFKTGDAKKGSGGCIICDGKKQDDWTTVDDKTACNIDGEPCLLATCQTGTCTKGKVKKGFCHIELAKAATCVDNGALNPANECQFCDASDDAKINDWTSVASGKGCKADDITCTTDLCDGQGACVHTPAHDQCSAAKGECQKNVCSIAAEKCTTENVATDIVCDGPDGVTCTVETCDGKGKCEDKGKPTTDPFCDDKIACTADACIEGKGCTHTPQKQGKEEHPCDDGNVCTDDKCDLATGCVHPPNKASCDNDKLPCTLPVCDAGSCKMMIDATHCYIDGKSCAKKDDTAAQGCQVCKPSVAQDKWTDAASGAKCDGDGIACTADACDGKGVCGSKLAAGKCLIDKTCYGDGDLKDGSGKCQRCESKTKTDAWTNVAKSTPCEADGVGCTVDTCDGAGKCAHAPDDLKCTDQYGCTTNKCHLKDDCQFIDNCAWGHTCNKDANACTTKAPVILVKQSKDVPAPTNPAAVRHVIDSKTGKSRLWVVYQSQSCATASNGAWTIDKGATLQALALDSHSHVDAKGKGIELTKGGAQKPPTAVTLPSALKGDKVCQGYPVVAVDPESTSQAWVSWLEAGVGDPNGCLKSGGQGGVLRLGLLDSTTLPGSGKWSKVAGSTCTAEKFFGPLFITGGLGLLDGSNGSKDVGKRQILSVRSQGGDLGTWAAQKQLRVGTVGGGAKSNLTTSTGEFATVHATLIDKGKQAKTSDARYISLAIDLESGKAGLWALPLDGKGTKQAAQKWLDASAKPAAGGLSGISQVCSMDATFNTNTGEVGVVLVARDGGGGLDDRVYLVTKKGADKAKIVAIEDKGTASTGGACHFGLMAARIAATKSGFAVVYYGKLTPQVPTPAKYATVAGGKASTPQSLGALLMTATDTSTTSKSVPALAWRGIGDLVWNESDGTITIVAEALEVTSHVIKLFTFKP